MTLVAAAPKEHRVLLRVGLALLALLVAALVVFGLGALLAGTVPVAPKNPFGVGIREAAQTLAGAGDQLFLGLGVALHQAVEDGLQVFGAVVHVTAFRA